MNKRIEKLKNFIDKYGEDYLMDGTKRKILEALENEDEKLAIELLSSMDEEWVKEVKKSGNFRVFTDLIPVPLSEKNNFKPYYQTGYMGDIISNNFHIPVLKYIQARQRTFQRK